MTKPTGRPRGRPRVTRLALALTADELARVEIAAWAAGVSPEAWARHAVRWTLDEPKRLREAFGRTYHAMLEPALRDRHLKP